MSQIAPKPHNQAVSAITLAALPTTIARESRGLQKRFIEFFTAQIRNKNTRAAYARAVNAFFLYIESLDLDLVDIEPVHVAAYIEQLGTEKSPPTVKQNLAAIRMLFDWLMVGNVGVLMNPAQAVNGPKHVVKTGKTPVLTPEETRQLLDSIDTSTVVGLRDRALIGLLVYTFSRISAAVAITVEDYFPQKKRMWVRLAEKGGKQHSLPCHHVLEDYLDEYIEAAGIREERKMPLFRSARGRSGELTEKPLHRANAWMMIQRRMLAAGLETHANCHTFRATGITTYLNNSGTLDKAQQMAAHESPRTTKLYDRTNEDISLDEVERIII